MKSETITITQRRGGVKVYIPPKCLQDNGIISTVCIMMDELGIRTKPHEELTFESDHHRITLF